MSKNEMHGVLALFSRHAESTPDNQSDSQLIERFTTQGEESAFRAILERHGPMVLSVCRRVLRDGHEAEDAFQATFLVLAKKATALRRAASLGSWLYQIAFRLAMNVRARLAQRQMRERAAAIPIERTTDNSNKTELVEVIDEELTHLPEKYRTVLVLCYLQSKTHEQAARELGWPIGTMSRRLGRALELLRGRLCRRGMTLTVGALATGLTVGITSAAVPGALGGSTTAMALTLVGGNGTVMTTGTVGMLAGHFLRSLAIRKFWTVAALVLGGFLCVGVAAGLLTSPKPAPSPNDLSDLRPVTNPIEVGPEWGKEVHGLRLRSQTDRPAYRMGMDLMSVRLGVLNTSNRTVKLPRDPAKVVELFVLDGKGTEYILEPSEYLLVRYEMIVEELKPGEISRLEVILDPSANMRFRLGRYHLHARFRGVEGTLLSQPTLFLLLDPQEVRGPMWQMEGQRVGTYSISLQRLGERSGWKPGESALPFSIVLNRLPMIPKHSTRGNMIYELEITSSDGVVYSTQSVMSRPLSQLLSLPVGKTVGDKVRWDPAESPPTGRSLEPLLRITGKQINPGKYTIRAIGRFDDSTVVLMSNVIEVLIED